MNPSGINHFDAFRAALFRESLATAYVLPPTTGKFKQTLANMRLRKNRELLAKNLEKKMKVYL